MAWGVKGTFTFLVKPGELCYIYSRKQLYVGARPDTERNVLRCLHAPPVTGHARCRAIMAKCQVGQMDTMSLIFVFLLGTIIGSFVNVCIHRMPRGESLIAPRSHCPACQASIRPIDNIPILSFFLLRGKCRHCGQSIPWRYPVVEFLNGAGYVLLALKFGLVWQTPFYALLFSALIVVTFIDLTHQIIPNEITLPGILIGMIAAGIVLPQGFWSSLIGLVLGGGLFYLIADLSQRMLKQEGMGGGDIKLIAMIGAFLGWKSVLLTIFMGALSGSLVGIFLILVKGKGRRFPIPFGPFLALGALTSLFWGREILHWYFSGGFWGR